MTAQQPQRRIRAVDDLSSADMPAPRRALVTGASTGIGAATVRRLRNAGWEVLATARRVERLEELADETGCTWFAADLTDADDVAALAEHALATGGITSLVNNAGGAIGVDPVADGAPEDWLAMYERNVLSALRLTQALLPGLRESGGDVLFLTSTAALNTYPGGGGYVAAKHAEGIVARTLRLELVGEPVRVIEIAPGMVKTEEFSLNRLGDTEAAEAVYAGVEAPLTAADVAETIAFALEAPSHVNVDLLVLRPRAQASNTLVARDDRD